MLIKTFRAIAYIVLFILFVLSNFVKRFIPEKWNGRSKLKNQLFLSFPDGTLALSASIGYFRLAPGLLSMSRKSGAAKFKLPGC